MTLPSIRQVDKLPTGEVKGQGNIKKEIHATDASNAGLTVSEHGSYNCTSEKHLGRLFVSSEGVRFETAVRSKEKWRMQYDEMNRIEKVSNKF